MGSFKFTYYKLIPNIRLYFKHKYEITLNESTEYKSDMLQLTVNDAKLIRNEIYHSI